MLMTLNRWAIEVDENRLRRVLATERAFIRDFGSAVYREIDQGAGPLSILRYVYFTRIFMPQRDSMGSYVRLHFFMADLHQTAAMMTLDRMLLGYKTRGMVFQIRKEEIDGIQEASSKGAESFPELYYGYMEALSRTAVQLFWRGVTDGDMHTITLEWGHNLANLLLGGDPV